MVLSLGTFAWELSLGNIRLESLSLGNLRSRRTGESAAGGMGNRELGAGAAGGMGRAVGADRLL